MSFSAITNSKREKSYQGILERIIEKQCRATKKRNVDVNYQVKVQMHKSLIRKLQEDIEFIVLAEEMSRVT